jgi:hypothetical protein
MVRTVSPLRDTRVLESFTMVEEVAWASSRIGAVLRRPVTVEFEYGDVIEPVEADRIVLAGWHTVEANGPITIARPMSQTTTYYTVQDTSQGGRPIVTVVDEEWLRRNMPDAFT